MAGYGKLVVGIVFLIIGILLLLGAAITANTYNENLKTYDKNKEARDSLESLGADTSEADNILDDNEQTLANNRAGMTWCSIIGIILIIIGIFFYTRWRKDKKMQPPAPQYPPQQPPQQYPQQQPPPQYPPQQPQQQYQQPPQYPQY